MSVTDVWPAVFVAWKSKSGEVFQSIKSGKIDANTGKLHLRKGAEFVIVLEDGTLVASGRVSSVTGSLHDTFLTRLSLNLDEAPRLPSNLLDKVQALPRSLLKAPVNAFVIPPDRNSGPFNSEWFSDAYSAAEKLLPPASGSHEATKSKNSRDTKVLKEEVAKVDEREALLKGWLPPVLQGLLAEHVRADQWELLVAYAFRALGCKVTYQGQKAGAKAVPDCTARYTSPSGQLIELVIDAKAGCWHGAVDDIRAMRDYVELAMPYSYPLFVANSVAADVPDKLRQHIMHGKIARAISGRDLAQLIYQRLTDPNFNVEFELRRFFL